jgi:hypothetical protein
VLHRPILLHLDKIRRHQTPNAVFWITEQRCRHVAFLGREETDQLARRGAWQFLQQRRAIVRRHLIQNGNNLLVCHRPQQFLLFFDPDVFEDVRRERCWKDAKDDHLFVFGKIEDYFGHIGRGPLAKQLPQRAEISGVDQTFDFWCEKITDHVAFLTLALAQSNGARTGRMPRCGGRLARRADPTFSAWNLRENSQYEPDACDCYRSNDPARDRRRSCLLAGL